jgi:hypothetical protein
MKAEKELTTWKIVKHPGRGTEKFMFLVLTINTPDQK